MEGVDMIGGVAFHKVSLLAVNGEYDRSLGGGRRTADLSTGARHVALLETVHVRNWEDPGV